MDEQEVTENGSEETANDQLHDSGEIMPPLSDSEELAAESETSQDAAVSDEDDSNQIGLTINPEELPTMQWSDVDAELAEFEALQGADAQDVTASASNQPGSAESGPLEGLEDAMSWLEQLAAGQGMPIDEMPTLVTAQPAAESQPQEELESVGVPPESVYPAPDLEIDSDPMAWLEQLAVDQSSPLEELPSVADRLLASEIISLTEIPANSTINDPYDVDQALSYLEQLAVAQNLDLSDVSFDSELPVDSLDEALSIIDGMALAGLVATSVAVRPEALDEEQEVPAVVVDERTPEEPPEQDHLSELSADMPNDPQQALDWLSDFGEESDDSSMEVIEDTDTAGPPLESSESGDADAAAIAESVFVELEKASEGSQNDTDVLEEMPEDPDEAVAWMENLATSGSQAASKSETPSKSGLSSVQSESLREAQAALEDGNLDQAISVYQNILEEDAATDELIEALEGATATYADSPRLLRLLGDTYMQKGEVDKAIATYRKGFDHL